MYFGSSLSRFAFAGVTALTIVLCRWLFISEFANETPFWDQWDAEAWRLYRPYLIGELGFSDLFSAHNEHRIFVTRVWSLALLGINDGIWSPVFQMKANAVIYGIFCFILIYSLSTFSRGFELPALCAAVLFVACSPFAWENTLAGFQSQFYFVLLFSLSSILFIAHGKSLVALGWALLFSVLACLSSGGGVAAPLTVCCMIGYRSLVRGSFPSRDQLGLLSFATIFVSFYMWTPTVVGHEELKAASFLEFFAAAFKSFSWPVIPLSGLWIAWVPLVLLVFIQSKDEVINRHVVDEGFLVKAISLWVIVQLLSISLSRADAVFASRYMDIYALGLVMNLYIASYILRIEGSNVFSGVKFLIVFVWGAGLLAALPAAIGFSWQQAVARSELMSIQQERVQAYICRNDSSAILRAPHMHIPYPDGPRLKMFLDDEVIRGILHPSLLRCYD